MKFLNLVATVVTSSRGLVSLFKPEHEGNDVIKFVRSLLVDARIETLHVYIWVALDDVCTTP